MPVRELTCDDWRAYAIFRQELWPDHASAGYWEVVQKKYFENPHRSICAQSGLYGYFQGDRLLGTMGAYPMPVTCGGTLYPGHMLVDWAVLSNFRFGPVAGQLWSKLFALPGRKYGSVGTQFSQPLLEKRGKKIVSREAACVLNLRSSVAVKLLDPKRYGQASPIHLDELEMVPGVSLLAGEQVRAAVPGALRNLARVHRDSDFWRVYCEGRLYHGGFPLRVVSGEGESDIVVRITEIGRFRFAMLLSAYLNPYSVACARATGRLLRRLLERLKVGVMYVTEADEELAALANSVSKAVHRATVHWWSIPRPTDTFRSEDVPWWLTSAERDGIYGGIQPCVPR